MNDFDAARSAGFSDSEITDYANSQRDTFRAAGFSDAEIDKEFGQPSPATVPPSLLSRFTSGARDVGSAVAEGARAGFGDEPIGPPVEDMRKLQTLGFPDWASLSLGAAYTTAQTMFRGLNAALTGTGAGVGEVVAKATGANEAEAAGARRDWANMLGVAALLTGASHPMTRSTPAGDQVVGHLPVAQDFTDATKAVAGGDVLPETRQAIVSLYQDHGIHPAEVAHDAQSDPSVATALRAGQMPARYVPEAEPSAPPPRKSDILPIEGSREAPELSRAELARTGVPNIDAVLADPQVSRAINDPVVNRTNDTPYGAGPGASINDRLLNIDRHVPRAVTVDGVTFDPAEPFAVHEFVERKTMDELMQGGMDVGTAYKVAHFEFAEKAEGAWYRAHGIDQAKAEALYRPLLDQIQHDNPANPPASLFTKPYPHDDVAMAQREPTVVEPRPTESEIGRANAILDRTRNAVSPDAIPVTRYAAALRSDDVLRGPEPGGSESPGPRQGGLGAPAGRPPYHVYDDRGALRKAFESVADAYKRTFQPELVSDDALKADPLFARYRSMQAMQRDRAVAAAEGEYQFWRRTSEADRLDYMDHMERGAVTPDLQTKAIRHRDMLRAAYDLERQFGSKAGYVQDYFPHIWEDPIRARSMVEARTAQLGPSWFQKERTFNFIREGLEASLRLKSSNPEDIVTQRLLASADMVERMRLLQSLEEMGLATRAKGADPALGRMGWSAVNAPDREQWLLAPDIQPLWKNAVEAKGLWANEGMTGSGFRGWMALKNVWVPIKLALSLFHPLHVLHINYVQGLARAWDQVVKGGDVLGALKSAAEGFYGSVQAAVPGVPHIGKQVREAWLLPEADRTPWQRAAVDLMNDGGFVPQLSEQLKINAKRSLENAWDNSQWLKTLPAAMRRSIEVLQAPIFERWIPNLKAAAYLNDAQALLTRRPELLDDEVQRRVAMRTIAKSIDNRFGEMNYGGLFWDRYVKDASIGSFLSLGWQLGMAREFGGALLEPEARLIRRLAGGETESQATIRQAQNKVAYTVAYVSTAMLISGAMTYMFTGTQPEGLDWFFPRIGGTNADGSPRRVTTMFYTREAPMLQKHIEAHGGNIITGSADMLYNKLMVQPIKEMWDNRDYFGNDIYDENSPIWKQGAQAVTHLFGEQFNPMSVSGARQSLSTGGGWSDAALAFLGFTPAPSYAEKSATQNRIAYLFGRHVAPFARPADMGELSKARGDIRNEWMLAKQRGDQDGMGVAEQKWLDSGGSRTGMNNIRKGITGDIAMFRGLPAEDQKAILEQATPEERDRYRPFAKSTVAGKIADIVVEGQRARQAGDMATATAHDKRLHAAISRAAHAGDIPDADTFRQAVTNEIIQRYGSDLPRLLNVQQATISQRRH